MIEEINEIYRNEINNFIRDNWAGPFIVTKGKLHDTSKSCGFVWVEEATILGYVLYNIQDNECEILVLESLKQNCGIGTALIEVVKSKAKGCNCSCVWLITTNDNFHAIRYYHMHGFALAQVHINSIVKSRILKSSIPLIGDNGISIRHEFEFIVNL